MLISHLLFLETLQYHFSTIKEKRVYFTPTIYVVDPQMPLTALGGSSYPYMDVEAGELTIGDVERLLSLYKDVVTKYTSLRAAVRHRSLSKAGPAFPHSEGTSFSFTHPEGVNTKIDHQRGN